MFWTHTASYSFTSGHQMASFPGMEISWLTLSVRTFDLNSQTSWFRTKNTPQNTCILQNGEISNMVPTVLITVSWYAGVASGAKEVRNTADLARGSFWHSWAVTFWDMLNHRLLRPVWSTPSKSYLNLQTAFPYEYLAHNLNLKFYFKICNQWKMHLFTASFLATFQEGGKLTKFILQYCLRTTSKKTNFQYDLIRIPFWFPISVEITYFSVCLLEVWGFACTYVWYLIFLL